MSINEKEQREKLINIIREAVAGDNALREKFQVGDKFRFVRDRLQALLDQLEQHAETKQAEEIKRGVTLVEDEILIYVYLYNAQGVTLQTWVNMLTPKLFYEYSVNRPIYLDKNHIESLIRSKSNKMQHAFLTVAIKQKDVIQNDRLPQDVLGHVIVKVREGSLKFERFIVLTHNENDYILDQSGILSKQVTR
jgi:intracellular multiplication protein IcmQ